MSIAVLQIASTFNVHPSSWNAASLPVAAVAETARVEDEMPYAPHVATTLVLKSTCSGITHDTHPMGDATQPAY